MGLKPEENPFPVEKLTEQYSQAQPDQGHDKITEAGGDSRVEELLNVTTGETETEPVEANDVVGQVNRDRVHSDPHEWHAPFLAFPDINHEIEKTQQEGAVAAGHQDVRGGPDLLDDWKLESPNVPQQHTRQAGKEQVMHLSPVLNPVALEQESGEYAEQTGRHGWQRAQNAFRVPGAVPFFAGKVLLI